MEPPSPEMKETRGPARPPGLISGSWVLRGALSATVLAFSVDVGSDDFVVQHAREEIATAIEHVSGITFALEPVVIVAGAAATVGRRRSHVLWIPYADLGPEAIWPKPLDRVTIPHKGWPPMPFTVEAVERMQQGLRIWLATNERPTGSRIERPPHPYELPFHDPARLALAS